MSRQWSRQEDTRQGIAWNLLFRNEEDFFNKLILRNTYTTSEYSYVWKLLNSLLADKIFRFTSHHRCIAQISTKVEVIMTMMKIFNENEGTDIRKYSSNTSLATYEEDASLDIDNLDSETDNVERIGNRESGAKTQDQSINYSVNEIINREKRIHDYITKEIVPLFSSRTQTERKENRYDY